MRIQIGQHYLYEILIDHFRAWVFEGVHAFFTPCKKCDFRAWVFEGLGVTCVFYTLQKMRL